MSTGGTATHRRQLRCTRTVVVALVTLGTFGLTACDPPSPPPSPPTGACRPQPFTDGFQQHLDSLGAAAHHVTAAVYDDRTGCWYHLRQGMRVTTASVVKIEVMAATMLRAQDRRRELSRSEMSRIHPMVTASDNAATTSLWGDLGGVRAMRSYGARLGLDATEVTEPLWGMTSTTAEDQAGFVERLMQGGVPLSPAMRGLAWVYLRGIRADQRWGVRAGVPAGWEVGHKNGFAGSSCCGWRVNSVGYVADPSGGGYSVAILSDGWASMGQGIPMVEAVARQVAGSIAN